MLAYRLNNLADFCFVNIYLVKRKLYKTKYECCTRSLLRPLAFKAETNGMMLALTFKAGLKSARRLYIPTIIGDIMSVDLDDYLTAGLDHRPVFFKILGM